jgi:predicted ABC-type sugar transport system permease subunit
MARIVTDKTDKKDEAVDKTEVAPRANAALSGRTRLALGAMQGLGLGGFYVIVLIYFSIAAAPYFFSESNAVNILSNISVIGIVTIGQALVLIAGGFDLSVAGTVPLGGVIFTILINRGLNIPEAWVIAVLGGCGIGVANGLIITRVGINAWHAVNHSRPSVRRHKRRDGRIQRPESGPN